MQRPSTPTIQQRRAARRRVGRAFFTFGKIFVCAMLHVWKVYTWRSSTTCNMITRKSCELPCYFCICKITTHIQMMNSPFCKKTKRSKQSFLSSIGRGGGGWTKQCTGTPPSPIHNFHGLAGLPCARDPWAVPRWTRPCVKTALCPKTAVFGGNFYPLAPLIVYTPDLGHKFSSCSDSCDDVKIFFFAIFFFKWSGNEIHWNRHRVDEVQ